MFGDAVWVAFITGPLTLLLTHYLGQRDRSLASEAVKAKDVLIETMKLTHAGELRDRDDIIRRLHAKLVENGIEP